MIYILPVNYKNVSIRKKRFPEHSYGFNIETGFLDYLQNNGLVTDDPQKADWHYLPVMWSFWQLSNDYGRINRQPMQELIDRTIIDPKKTFTVSEADNEPGFNMDGVVVFSGNQSIGYHGHKWIPVPLITLPHRLPLFSLPKRYLSNFVGTISPWKTRIDMLATLNDRSDIKIVNSKKGESQFVDTILMSYSTLCPRGSALGSYRFYESMQMGVVPIMISDEDFRPFPGRINWNECSYYLNHPSQLTDFFDLEPVDEMLRKGEKAKEVWDILSTFWPEYILDELNENHT